jgi:hypothetical protein
LNIIVVPSSCGLAGDADCDRAVAVGIVVVVVDVVLVEVQVQPQLVQELWDVMELQDFVTHSPYV